MLSGDPPVWLDDKSGVIAEHPGELNLPGSAAPLDNAGNARKFGNRGNQDIRLPAAPEAKTIITMNKNQPLACHTFHGPPDCHTE